MVPLIVLAIILAFLTLDYAVERTAQMRLAAQARRAPVPKPVPIGALRGSPLGELPPGLFIGPGHVWVRLGSGGKLRVGVDRLLLSLLGGLDAVYTLNEGAEVTEQGPLVMLRRDDRALKVRSPIEGRITAVNEALLASPEEAAADPFDKGWIYEITPAPESQAVRHLPSGDEARSWMAREVGRLRDLLSDLMGGGALGEPTLADGGAPSETFAEHIGDPEWEKLLARFFGAGSSGEADR